MSAGLSPFVRSIFLAASVAASCALVPSVSQAQGARGAEAGDFDYYLLTLSWSPTYCDGQAEDGRQRDRYDRYDGYGGYRYNQGGGFYRYNFYGNRYGRNDYDRYNGDGYDRRGAGSGEQCNSKRPYAFVLHGLWPQYERRGWPEMCEVGRRPWVPEETIDRMMDIMPSRGLVIQEYKKHGVCSGLDPRDYFKSAREAFQSIHIPEEYQTLSKTISLSPEDVRRSFLDANKQLSADMVQVVCSRRLLQEVRVCLSKDLTPRPCPPREQNRHLCNYDSVLMPPVRGGGLGPHGGPTQKEDRREDRM